MSPREETTSSDLTGGIEGRKNHKLAPTVSTMGVREEAIRRIYNRFISPSVATREAI
jgi:hypothetical protein